MALYGAGRISASCGIAWRSIYGSRDMPHCFRRKFYCLKVQYILNDVSMRIASFWLKCSHCWMCKKLLWRNSLKVWIVAPVEILIWFSHSWRIWLSVVQWKNLLCLFHSSIQRITITFCFMGYDLSDIGALYPLSDDEQTIYTYICLYMYNARLQCCFHMVVFVGCDWAS